LERSYFLEEDIVAQVIHTPYRVISGGLVIPLDDENPVPFITDMSQDITPGPALEQTSWGPHGPQEVLDFDTQRQNKIEMLYRGHTFSGRTKSFGRVGG
jgi:hypothetical protein